MTFDLASPFPKDICAAFRPVLRIDCLSWLGLMKLDASVVREVCVLILRVLTHLQLSIYPNSVSRSPPVSTQFRDLRGNHIGMMDWLDSAIVNTHGMIFACETGWPESVIRSESRLSTWRRQDGGR